MPQSADKSPTVRTVLVAFGLAVAGPLVILMAVLLFRSAAADRAELEQRLLKVVASLAEGIDRDLDRRIALLQTLATSAALEKEDWPAFYAQATAALQDRAYLILIDREGRQVINTFVPYGQAPAFTGDPVTLQRMLKSPGPVVSDLFVSRVVKSHVFNVSIPIHRNGTVRYIMSLGLLPTDVLKILEGQQLDAGWVGSVWDRQDVLIARSRNHDQFVGTQLPERFRLMRPGGTAVFRTVNLDGEHIILANSTSKLAEWRIAVSVPMALAEAPLRSSIRWWIGAALLAVLVAAGLASLVGNMLVKPLDEAARAARAFGRGEPIAPASLSKLREVNALTSALHEAGERQRLLVRELSHRVKNVLAVVQALVLRSISDGRTPAQSRELIEQRLQALARAHDLMIKSEWRGAALIDIMSAELAPYGGRIHMSGPDLQLNAGVVQSLGIIVHELATNAAKYGALSLPSGSVTVMWRVERGELDEPDENFHLEWRERGGPPILPPASRGFGTSLLEAAFPEGRAQLSFDPPGFVYQLDAPLAAISGAK